MIRRRKKFWLKFLITVIVVCCSIVITLVFKYDTILNQFENFLINSEAPEAADLIIVLAGNDMSQRVVSGVKLYEEGYGGKILMSGGPYYWNSTCAQIMKNHAVHLGVPADAILLEEKSTTTYENAKYSLDIMTGQGYKSAIVVTSPYHTRRTKIIFEHLFDGKGIDLAICSFEPDTSNDKKWWQDELSTQFIVNEYLKLLWDKLFAD